MLKCIIVDDESHARSELSYLIKQYEELQIVGEASNALEALKLCEQDDIDLLFVDIQMPQVNGIELADVIMNKENPPHIIFVTAYDKFAISAFKVNAIDYLLKPLDEKTFQNTIINKVYPLLNKKESEQSDHILKLRGILSEFDTRGRIVPKLTVSVEDKLIPLNYSKIIYITVEDRDTVVYTRSQKYTVNRTLSELNNFLNDQRFFRCHKSFIINTHYIDTIEPWFNATLRLKMKGIKEMIPVSRSYIKDFKCIMYID